MSSKAPDRTSIALYTKVYCWQFDASDGDHISEECVRYAASLAASRKNILINVLRCIAAF